MQRFLFLILGMIFAQSYASGNNSFHTLLDTTAKKKEPRYILGVSPSAFLNVYTGFQLSHRFKIYKRLNASVETGYIFTRALRSDLNLNGYRLRPEINLDVFETDEAGFSLFISYTYRYLKTDLENTVFRNGGNYFETVKGNLKTTLDGFSFGLNVKNYNFIGNRSLKFGFGVGFGFLDNVYSDPDLVSQRFVLFSTSQPGSNPFPIFLFNLNIDLVSKS